MDVLAVVKDPGGINAVLPVGAELRKSSASVQVVANGKAVELLPAMNVEHVAESSAEAVIQKFGEPKILLTSMCSDGGVGRDLVPLLHGKSVTVAVQDFWGARLWTEWADPKFRPDHLIVPDSGAKDIVHTAWPDFDPEHIHALGWVAFDKYVDMYPKRAQIAADTRRVLGIADSKPILLFCGGGDETGMLLDSLVSALNDVPTDFYVMARPHPRTKNNYPNEMIPWQEALANLKRGTLVVDFFGQTDGPSLIAAADVVVADFSTMLIEAAMLRKPAISLWYPEVQRFWNREIGGRAPMFPLISMGCALCVQSPQYLADVIANALNGHVTIKENQESMFPNTEKSASRAAEFIRSLL